MSLRPVNLNPACSIRKTCPCGLYHFTPLLYSKTGVYRGIHFFLIFALKHSSWVPTIYVLSNHYFSSENYHFYIREELLYIAWACFHNVSDNIKCADLDDLHYVHRLISFFNSVVL